MTEEKENIVKKTCKELGLTYKQLGELIGYSESAIKSAIAKDEVSEPMSKAIQMQFRNKSIKKRTTRI
ncbi:TPA: transcriptional regulator [Campylobacter jejuni]